MNAPIEGLRAPFGYQTLERSVKGIQGRISSARIHETAPHNYIIPSMSPTRSTVQSRWIHGSTVMSHRIRKTHSTVQEDAIDNRQEEHRGPASHGVWRVQQSVPVRPVKASVLRLTIVL